MAIVPDPFTQVYGATYDALVAHTPFTDLVKLGNRIRYDKTNPVPLKGSLLTADTPEVTLVPTGGPSEPTFSSSSAQLVQNLTIKEVSGDQRVQKILFPLKWETIRALRIAGGTLGLAFVNNLMVTEQEEAVDDFDESKGQQGWISEITIEVTMIIARSELES